MQLIQQNLWMKSFINAWITKEFHWFNRLVDLEGLFWTRICELFEKEASELSLDELLVLNEVQT